MIVIKTPRLDTIPDGCSDCLLWGTRLDGESICRALELLSCYDGEVTNPYIDYYLDVGGRHKDCPLVEVSICQAKLRFKHPQKMELA